MTENESLLAQQKELYVLEKMLSEKQLTLEEMESILPAFFHVNSLEDSSLIYCTKEGCEYLGIEHEELMPYSAEQLASINTPYTMEHIVPRFVEFYQEKDYYKVISAFQQIRRRGERRL